MTLVSSSVRKCGLFVTCVVFLLSVPVFSQANLGRILGSVTDQTGGVIAGATVTVLDVQRGISRTLTTDGAGEYNAPNLTPGTYTVRVESDSSGGQATNFGCGCNTPDQASPNPVLGTGGSRSIQLGLKLIW